MVIQSLFNHNFIEPPEDHDILADFSPNSKKLIALEVVETLSLRYIEALHADEAISSPVLAKPKQPASLPVLLEPMPSSGNALWKLPTWKHVKWAAHSMAPVFTLSLDSLNSISNAVKIYCLWLKNPKSRPVGVKDSNLEEFISFILFDLSELFEPRKGNDTKNSQFTKRHAELCHLVIKTIIFELVPNSPLFSQKASKSWNLLARLLLGITDNLLWNDKQNYLAEDLAESLLNSLFFVFLRGGIYTDELWKKFASCFKLWCHRLKSVLVWGSVIVSLTFQVAKALYYSPDPSETVEIVFGMHSADYRIITDLKFANYSWIRLTNFLPKVSGLSGDIFLRALQSLEKIINIWFSSATSIIQHPHGTPLDRTIPNSNTLFEIYGEMIFEAASIEKSTHENGRAIAISLICRILAKWQYREPISDQYLSLSCESLKAALSSDLHACASVLFNIEAVFVAGHTGILSLITPIFMAIRRIIPKGKIQKSPLYNVPYDVMRMCCYRLLSMIFCYYSEIDSPLSYKFVDWNILKPLDHSHSIALFHCYSKSLKSHAILLKAHLLDTLIGSLYLEDNPSNTRFLLNSVSALLYADYKEFPELFPVLMKTFENLLCKPPAIWTSSVSSLVDTQITIVRILEQWSRLGPLPAEQAEKLCSDLIQLAVSLHSKANLPLYFRLIISLYETLFSWLSVSGTPSFTCISAFISALVKFTNDPNASKTKKLIGSASAGSVSVPVSPTGPSIYGLKTRKSLTERLFTLELGSEDQRPESLSPTFLKGFDEIFVEYTDSIIQKLLNLLLQEQINTNYPVKLDFYSGNEGAEEEEEELGVKYFSLSSSILIGFNEKFLFVRNSIGKFIWRHEYKKAEAFKVTKHEHEHEHVHESSTATTSTSIVLDETMDINNVFPFRTPIVVTDLEADDEDEIILNDANWKRSLNNNKTIAAKITPVLNEVKEHLHEILPEIPMKSRLNLVKAQEPVSIDYPEIISRLFLTHLGFLNSSTCALISPLNPKDYSSFISDLKKLDSLSCRESINIPIYFLNVKDKDLSVSKSFECFVKGLGSFTATSSGPIFADSSLEVNFPIVLETTSTTTSTTTTSISCFNESISILWSEDFEPIQSIPNSNSNFVHLLISPVLINMKKGQFFRIRILLASTLQPEYNSLQSIYNSFGPLVDGMIVKKSILSQMIRETSIFSHRFISNYIENSPNPIMKRQTVLKSLIFKYHESNTYGSILNSLL